MTDWGGGYVTDIGYDPGYYREQSPSQLRLACLMSGVVWDVPDEGAHYLELGCGLGLGAMVIAASNPSWRVTALDFNPAHIASARAMARKAGISNVTFIEADLTDFAESPVAAALPEADIVTAHGVWSWVAPPVRAGIVRLLQTKLRAGGVLHLSYNALPGWQGMIAVQRLVREAGSRLPLRSDQQAQAGIQVLRELYTAQAKMLGVDARTGNWLAEAGDLPPAYLAHEFMNAHWSPCWHSEVVAALSEARMNWVSTATLIENFNELAMTTPQRAVFDRFDDPLMRELIKDLCIGRTLRHDVFVRGARRVTAEMRDAAIRDLTLMLAVPVSKVRYEVDVAIGKAEFGADFYRPVIEMLAKGPARIADLLHAPGAVAERENPTELAGMLVGTRQALVITRPGATATPEANRLNALIADRVAVTENLNRVAALASVSLGAGMPCGVIDAYVAGRALAGEADGDIDAWTGVLAHGLNEENTASVRKAVEFGRNEMLGIIAQAGCVPAA